MKNITIQSEVCFCSYEELDDDARRLIDKARNATENSNSKYSGFNVGAALRLANGMEIIGANQENAAFPVTICAERSAIFNAQSNYPQSAITHLAVAARNKDGFTDIPVSPCGSCRQVMLEMEDRYNNNIKIYLYGQKGVYVVDSAKDLLPLSFVDSSMH
ncbi:MAG: cytidine deaminase [Prevotella sp.]